MKFCPKCGNQLIDSAHFCDKCGYQQPVVNRPLTQPQQSSYIPPQPPPINISQQNLHEQHVLPQCVQQPQTQLSQTGECQPKQIQQKTDSSILNNSIEQRYNLDETPADNSSLILICKLAGWGCYVFAIIDFCGMFFGYDLTGVFWSPILAGLIGYLLSDFLVNKLSGVKPLVEEITLDFANEKLAESGVAATSINLDYYGDDIYKGTIILTDGTVTEQHTIEVKCDGESLEYNITSL